VYEFKGFINMKASNNCIAFICKFEGFRAKPYLDPAGIPTIGYGSTYYANGAKVMLNDDAITEQEAMNLMRTVLPKYEDAVNRHVQVVINQNQFDALVSFAYNLGNEALRTSILLKRINAGLFEEAGNEFLRWVYADGKKLAGLERRRSEERVMFLTPVNKIELPTQGDTKMLEGYKTYLGIAITVLGSLSALFGWNLGDLAGLQDQVIALVGAVLALYGRFVTKA
jgi:lysozyme